MVRKSRDIKKNNADGNISSNNSTHMGSAAMGRKRETVLAVPPVRVHTTITFAPISCASVHAECASAYDNLVIL